MALSRDRKHKRDLNKRMVVALGKEPINIDDETTSAFYMNTSGQIQVVDYAQSWADIGPLITLYGTLIDQCCPRFYLSSDPCLKLCESLVEALEQGRADDKETHLTG